MLICLLFLILNKAASGAYAMLYAHYPQIVQYNCRKARYLRAYCGTLIQRVVRACAAAGLYYALHRAVLKVYNAVCVLAEYKGHEVKVAPQEALILFQ